MKGWSGEAIESYFCDGVNITTGEKIQKADYLPPCPFPYLPAGFADDIGPGFSDIADPTDCSILYGDAVKDYDKKCNVYMAINLVLLALTARWLIRFRKRRTKDNRTFSAAKTSMTTNELLCWFCWWTSVVMTVHSYDIHNFNDDLPEWLSKLCSQTNSFLLMAVGVELCKGWVKIVHRLQSGRNEIPQWYNVTRITVYSAAIFVRIIELGSIIFWMEKGTQHGNINALKSVTEATISIVLSWICWRQGRAISKALKSASAENIHEGKVIKRYLYCALCAFGVAFAYKMSAIQSKVGQVPFYIKPKCKEGMISLAEMTTIIMQICVLIAQQPKKVVAKTSDAAQKFVAQKITPTPGAAGEESTINSNDSSAASSAASSATSSVTSSVISSASSTTTSMSSMSSTASEVD